MDCARCGSKHYVKAGMNYGKQRYKCKDCGYHYSVEYRGRYPKEVRECALRMVADGMGFRQVERALGVSNVTVMRWVRVYGETLVRNARKLLNKQQEYTLVEVDELCTFIGQKKGKPGYGYVLIEIAKPSSVGDLAVVIREP